MRRFHALAAATRQRCQHLAALLFQGRQNLPKWPGGYPCITLDSPPSGHATDFGARRCAGEDYPIKRILRSRWRCRGRRLHSRRRGWFLDPTPYNDSEFSTLGNQGEQRRMDLLTVLEEETGHLLGFDHEETGVMGDTLATGTRRTPSDGIHTGRFAAVDWLFSEMSPRKRR